WRPRRSRRIDRGRGRSRVVSVPVDTAMNREGSEQSARSPRRFRMRRGLLLASFLSPALIFLGALVVYPIVYTIVRSFYSRGGDDFVGFDNYVTMFTNETTFTAIRNNVMWVI